MKKNREKASNFTKKQIEQSIDGAFEKSYPKIQNLLNITCGRNFDVGFELGRVSRANSQEEGYAWLRRNFGNKVDFIFEMVEAYKKNEAVCQKCNNENTSLSKFCSNCGEKLNGTS